MSHSRADGNPEITSRPNNPCAAIQDYGSSHFVSDMGCPLLSIRQFVRIDKASIMEIGNTRQNYYRLASHQLLYLG